MDWLKKGAMSFVDGVYSVLPQPLPSREKLESVKIISHRGESDNLEVHENTFKAFDPLINSGVWGLECDIQWTKDQKPVLSHDPDLRRLFNSGLRICDLHLKELQNRFPQIPTLEELISRYGGQLHLMIEIKNDGIGLTRTRSEVLKTLLVDLEPMAQYHFLALDSESLEQIDIAPSESLLPVAETNTRKMSHLAFKNNWAGVAGHYALLDNTFRDLHQGKEQKIGTGFIGSKACLYREINRNVDWIFSNNAIAMQSIIERDLFKESADEQ